MFAVIKTGGKQYRVREGDILSVEKVLAEHGQPVNFDRVLLLEDSDQVQVGTPYLEKTIVRAEVLETHKDEKIIVFKKKRRKGYKRTKGHRQLQSKVKITGIFPDGMIKEAEKPRKEAVTKKPVKKAVAEKKIKPVAKKTKATRAPRKSKPSGSEKPHKEK
jgi:large subunit ribosomal protein L21